MKPCLRLPLALSAISVCSSLFLFPLAESTFLKLALCLAVPGLVRSSSLQGCDHHPAIIFHLGCVTSSLPAQLLIINYSSQICALQYVCCVLGTQLPTTDSLSLICFAPFGLYGYFIYLFLMTSAVWVCTFSHITQIGSPHYLGHSVLSVMSWGKELFL